MQTKAMAPSWHRAAAGVKVSTRKQSHLVHFADTHGEFSVADVPGAANMAVNRHIVRWVREDQMDAFIAEQRCIGVCVAGITANEPMAPQCPNVSRSAHSRFAL
jgi:hypothetical protein